MEITRNVILDLLPLYLANEVSADTRALIEKYLETDQELANVAKHSTAIELKGNIPVPLSKNDEMKTFKKAKRLIIMHTLILAGVIAFALFLIALAVSFFTPS